MFNITLVQLGKLQARLDKLTLRFIKQKKDENKALRNGIKAAESDIFSNSSEIANAEKRLNG